MIAPIVIAVMTPKVSCNIIMGDIQHQVGGVDCGVYAIAVATSLALAIMDLTISIKAA